MIDELALVQDNSFSTKAIAIKSEWEKFSKEWRKRYKKISDTQTPQLDGNGRKIIDRRPDGFDYINEAYMREMLTKHFPGWSWEMAAPVQLVGEWLVAQGNLCIIDEHLIILGINPPVRKYYGCGAARIQFKSEQAHTNENVVDIDKNVKSANTNAFKVAINRLTGIGDDVYGKRIEEDGAGSIEQIMTRIPSVDNFLSLISSWGVRPGELLKILKISSLGEITDVTTALNTVKEYLGRK